VRGGGCFLLASLSLILVTGVLILFVASTFANHEFIRRLDERKPSPSKRVGGEVIPG
jgi:hypothetical protein